jgi:hypothetical protein
MEAERPQNDRGRGASASGRSLMAGSSVDPSSPPWTVLVDARMQKVQREGSVARQRPPPASLVGSALVALSISQGRG